jgi:site-specific recombinase XerD
VETGTFMGAMSEILVHTNVKTTQIYAKVVDEKKEKAAQAIKLNINVKES